MRADTSLATFAQANYLHLFNVVVVVVSASPAATPSRGWHLCIDGQEQVVNSRSRLRCVERVMGD